MSKSNHKELPFTGERFTCDPSLLESQIYYEHLHRYLLAAELSKGKDVLDIASGEGYGSNLLAMRARSVVGIDCADDVVTYAARKYRRKNLSFVVGQCESIPLEAKTVDVVVSFETLEHLTAHVQFLREIKRVLRPGGLLIVSTPDREKYSLRGNRKNSFHKKELSGAEFKAFLSRAFQNVKCLQQKLIGGSFIAGAGNAPKVDAEYGVFRGSLGGGKFIPGLPDGLYIVAFCSDAKIPNLHLGIFEDPEASKRIWNSFETLPRIREQAERTAAQFEKMKAELATAGEKLRLGAIIEVQNTNERKRMEQEARELNEEVKRRGEWGLALGEELEALKRRIQVRETQTEREKLDWQSSERQLLGELTQLKSASRGWNEALRAEQARSEELSNSLILAHETERQQLRARCHEIEVECTKRQELIEAAELAAISSRAEAEKKQALVLSLTGRLILFEREKDQAAISANDSSLKTTKELELLAAKHKESLDRMQEQLDLAHRSHIESIRADRKRAEVQLANTALAQEGDQRVWRERERALEVENASLRERAEQGEIMVANLLDEANRKHQSILDLTSRLLVCERQRTEAFAEADERKASGMQSMETQRASHKASLEIMENQMAEAQRQFEISLRKGRELQQNVASLESELKRVCLLAASVQRSADELKQVKGSWSWKITGPLRRIHQAFGDPLSRFSR